MRIDDLGSLLGIGDAGERLRQRGADIRAATRVPAIEPGRVHLADETIEAGTVWINDWLVVRDEFEEGGYKQSGRGRLRGLASLEDFVEYRHIVLQPGVAAR